MKKLISLLLALVMCLSLAACGGGPDKQPAIDAFNNTSKTFNDFAAVINEDIESYSSVSSSLIVLLVVRRLIPIWVRPTM